MSYKRIIQLYNERRDKLQSLINDRTLQLKDERVHQIQGAVDEIGLFVSVLREYQEKTENDSFTSEVAHLMPNKRQGLFSRFRGVQG